MNTCIDLNDLAEHQGEGVLNLRKLFSYDEKFQFGYLENTEVKVASKETDNDFFETAIMILVILLLLDSSV